MVGKLLHWFYCLDLPQAVLVLALGTAAFWLIRQYVTRWRWIAGGALTVLVPVLLRTTLRRSGSGESQHRLQLFQSYRDAALTGNVEIYRSNFMNVALFFPAGLLMAALLPRRWPRWVRCLMTVLTLAATSVAIEYLQYRNSLGNCEADDVMHNTLGALLGALCGIWEFKRSQSSNNRAEADKTV